MSRKETLVLKPAPRAVPWSAKTCLLFGGTLGFLGWFFLAFGSVGVSFVVPELRFGLDDYADGTISLIEPTSSSINKETVYRNHYTFEKEGKTYQGASNTIGQQYKLGDKAGIEFQFSNPSNSRLEGDFLPIYVLLSPLLFPFVGLILALIRIRKGWRAIYMMAQGTLAWGKLTDKIETKTQINNQRVYKMVFVYRDEYDYAQRISTRTHIPHVLEDEEEEPILYHPEKPSQGVMADEWQNYISFSDDGRILGKSVFLGVMSLVLPSVCTLGYGALFVYMIARQF